MAKKPSDIFRLTEANVPRLPDKLPEIPEIKLPNSDAAFEAARANQEKIDDAFAGGTQSAVDRASARVYQAPPTPEYERFTVNRDDDVPLEFDGEILAVVEEGEGGADVTNDTLVRTRAAIYRTKGGKFIAEFSRYVGRQVASWGRRGPPKLFDKAGVFNTLDEAVGFFRPGRLTNALLEDLGVKKTEFIE